MVIKSLKTTFVTSIIIRNKYKDLYSMDKLKLKEEDLSWENLKALPREEFQVLYWRGLAGKIGKHVYTENKTPRISVNRVLDKKSENDFVWEICSHYMKKRYLGIQTELNTNLTTPPPTPVDKKFNLQQV